MKNHRYFYHWYYYTKSQKRGFVLLCVLVLCVHSLLCLRLYWQSNTSPLEVIPPVELAALQCKIDSLRAVEKVKRDTIYPFNPNYITDYKGYVLKLSVSEIDRLLAFRATHQYINNTEDFQRVTGVSKAWMEKYSPYFVFAKPPMRTNTKRNVVADVPKSTQKSPPPTVQDINQATAETLQQIRGIGPTLSARIIADRDKWGGYVHLDQLKLVYGLSEEVLVSLFQHYAVRTSPEIIPLNVNEASVEELKKIPYFNYYLAREVVKYRSLHGDFVNKEQLKEIEKIPLDRIHIISLYLKFRN